MGLEIAKTIYHQIGGNKFKAMTGADLFAGSDYSLQFSFKMCRKANKCKITLNSMDLYDVEFYKLNRKTWECPLTQEYKGIYCDQLESIFAEYTELNTRL